jgi:hypothetical protein
MLLNLYNSFKHSHFFLNIVLLTRAALAVAACLAYQLAQFGLLYQNKKQKARGPQPSYYQEIFLRLVYSS